MNKLNSYELAIQKVQMLPLRLMIARREKLVYGHKDDTVKILGGKYEYFKSTHFNRYKYQDGCALKRRIQSAI